MADLILSPIPVRPCIKCGACDRYAGGNCKACAKIMRFAWQLANRDKAKALALAWRTANPERKKAANAACDAANPKRKKATNASWVAANTQRIKANRIAWRAANPERNKATNAAWDAANIERRKAKNAAWRAANPEATRIQCQNRRARQRENGGVLSKGLADKLFKLQKGKCACCKQPLGADYHLDHIMPISLGGLNIDSNIQLLRQRCNQQKHAKHPVDFMQSRGFLL